MIARKEFTNHGLNDIISVEQRDVCQFGFSPDCDGKADAVFLDLPHPWLVVPFAVSSMKKLGKFYILKYSFLYFFFYCVIVYFVFIYFLMFSFSINIYLFIYEFSDIFIHYHFP